MREATRGVESKSVSTLDSPAEVVLKAGEEILRALTEITSVGVCIFQESRFQYVNQAMEFLSGYTRDELLAIDLMRLVHPDAAADVAEIYEAWTTQLIKDNRYELKGLGKQGQVVWAEVTGKTIQYRGRTALLMTVVNITGRRQTAEALRESEERLRLCISTAHFGTIDWDLVKDRHVWSPEIYEIFGIPPDTPLSLDYILTFIYPEDRQDATLATGHDPAGTGEYGFEYRIRRASDGATRWVYQRMRTIFAGEGADRRAVRVIGVIQDITDHKLTEEASRESEERLKLCISAARLGTYDYDLVNDRHIWSPEAYEIYGITPDQPLTMDYIRERVLTEDRRDDVVAAEFNPATSHGSYTLEYRIGRTSDGAIRWVQNTARIFFAGEGSLRKPVRMLGVIQDITERKLTEDSLLESEAKFRALAETSPAMVWLYQGDRLVYVNNTAAQLMGYTKAELLQMKFWEMVHPDFREMVKERGLARQRGEEVPSRYEVKHLTKAGETIWLEVTTGNIEYQGRPAVIATFFDITERKQAEDALKRSQYILAKSQETAHIGNWELNLQTGELLMSDENYRIFGVQPGEVQTDIDWVRSIVHPADKKLVDTFIENFMRTGEHVSLDYRIITRCGTVRYVNTITDQIVRDQAGQIKIVYGITQDITRRKESENALKRSLHILAKSQETAHVGNWAWNTQTGEITGSDEVFRLFGYDVNLGRTDIQAFINRVHPDDRPAIRTLAEKVVGEGATANTDYRLIMRDGSVRHMNAIADKTLRDATGKVRMVYGIQQDITDRKQAEMALEESKAQADLYLDLMGHDITNMNQIGIGFLELAMEAPGLSEAERHLLAKPLDAFTSSSRLIDNLRKLQKVKAGEMRRYSVDLSQVLEKVQADYTSLPGRKVQIYYRPLPGSVVLANELLYDLFANLVGNAIKHTLQEPVIGIRLEKLQKAGKLAYKISIEDNGPGIPETLKPRLFTRNLRGDTQAKGSGLGLYLVRTLATDYGGQAWVEDRVSGQPPLGSRFVVMLPAAEE